MSRSVIGHGSQQTIKDYVRRVTTNLLRATGKQLTAQQLQKFRYQLEGNIAEVFLKSGRQKVTKSFCAECTAAILDLPLEFFGAYIRTPQPSRQSKKTADYKDQLLTSSTYGSLLRFRFSSGDDKKIMVATASWQVAERIKGQLGDGMNYRGTVPLSPNSTPRTPRTKTPLSLSIETEQLRFYTEISPNHLTGFAQSAERNVEELLQQVRQTGDLSPLACLQVTQIVTKETLRQAKDKKRESVEERAAAHAEKAGFDNPTENIRGTCAWNWSHLVAKEFGGVDKVVTTTDCNSYMMIAENFVKKLLHRETNQVKLDVKAYLIPNTRIAYQIKYKVSWCEDKQRIFTFDGLKYGAPARPLYQAVPRALLFSDDSSSKSSSEFDSKSALQCRANFC